jgi:hypothetical protein
MGVGATGGGAGVVTVVVSVLVVAGVDPVVDVPGCQVLEVVLEVVVEGELGATGAGGATGVGAGVAGATTGGGETFGARGVGVAL